MKLPRLVMPSAFVAFAVLLFAPGAEAQTTFSDNPTRQAACFCVGEQGTGDPFCGEDSLCAGLMPCASTADCGPGGRCLDADNFCGQPVCIIDCVTQSCTTPGNTTDGFERCPDAAPTMGQWGLIALSALLLLGGAVMLRWTGRTTRAAIVIVALSLLTGAWAYASIRANPGDCGSAGSSVLADLGG